MKKRLGFVGNSSSSSFLLHFTGTNKLTGKWMKDFVEYIIDGIKIEDKEKEELINQCMLNTILLTDNSEYFENPGADLLYRLRFGDCSDFGGYNPKVIEFNSKFDKHNLYYIVMDKYRNDNQYFNKKIKEKFPEVIHEY